MRSLIGAISTCLLAAAISMSATAPGWSQQINSKSISVRTERYPRPPYSGATYYIYEENGQVICTKLEVCNKYDQCNRLYKKGAYKAQEDIETGAPYGTEPPAIIPPAKLAKHVCLTKYSLIGR